jgi:DNA polymerase/3'-5' exonuclease PolX
MDKARIPLAEAEGYAAEVVGLLAPFCERIEVAGSIRRRRPDVGDVEIVCVPRFDIRMGGMFEDEEERVNLQFEAVNRLRSEGVFGDRLDKNGRKSCGEKGQRLTYKGFALDVFPVVPPAQWGAVFLIRTGPGDFSHNMVTPKHMGGKMPMGLAQREGALWDRGVMLETPEEADYFAALGLPYIAPEARQ